ncbi:MAG: ATP-binding cassette domain-containing protein [Anaerolineaceae bacterium]|nr:ATP-binding cassette domain-containing protein [Anaerolineaceae bacterium]
MIIQLQDVSFAYTNEVPVFQHFNWDVQHGEHWTILGTSGCGKSTLLYLLAGLQTPLAGQIIINEELLQRPRPQTGLILQDYGLLPWATLRDNVSLGLRIRDYYGPDGKHAPINEIIPQIEARAEHWISQLGLAAIGDKYPGQVSGGQRQRTAIARTLSLNPDIILMDEPFSSLDILTRESLYEIVFELWNENHITTILVTHTIEDALKLGNKILILANPPNQEAIILDNPIAGQYSKNINPDYDQVEKITLQLKQYLEESQ